MARVTVIFPPLRVSRDFIDYPYFADLGAVQAAALLRAGGHETTLLDALAWPSSTLAEADPGYVTLGAPARDVLARQVDADVTIVAYTPFHRPPARDELLASILSGARGRVILADLYQSGQHFVDAPPAEILRAYPEARALLRFEAESHLLDLVERVQTLAQADDPLIVRGTEVRVLDELPLPAWDLVDLDAYHSFHRRVVLGLNRAAWAFPIDEPSVPIISSRGCPFRCVHCSSNPGRAAGAPKTQRRYSPAYLDRLLSSLAARGVRRVHVLDELANVNEAHFDALLALFTKHGLGFELPNGVRADYVLERHLEAMRGRLTTLSVSAESGSARVVAEVVDKQLDLGEIERVADRAEAAGVPLLVHFMIGLPGETAPEIEETLQVALRLREEHGAHPSVQFATPLPGTRLAEMAKQPGRSVLPMIEDYGPLFQKRASIGIEGATMPTLERFRAAFDRRAAEASAPRSLTLAITHRCNNRCGHCVTGTLAQIDGDPRALAELMARGRAEGRTSIELTGGEPTLHPHLFAMIRHARSLGYREVTLATNGRMASYPAFVDSLIAAGATSVRVGLHGSSEATHAAVTKTDGAFAQTSAGIQALASSGVNLTVDIVITRDNSADVVATAKLAESLGARRIRLSCAPQLGPSVAALSLSPAASGAIVADVAKALGDSVVLEVAGLTPCFLPGLEALAIPDPHARAEGARYASAAADVDVLGVVGAHRRKTAGCRGCPEGIGCAGFYEESPEPTWLVSAARLTRASA